MLQDLVFTTSLVLMTLLMIVFLFVVLQSGKVIDHQDASKLTGLWRKRIIWGLSLLFIPVLAFSMKGIPYPKNVDNTDAIVVDAIGYQWRWEISKTELPVGKPIEFRVGAADVTHGFAIYDANLHLLTQTQAMPGVVNVLRHTFDKPGIYKILCLEYCGLAHHNMMAELKVMPQ